MSDDPLALAKETFADPNFQKIDTCGARHPENLGTCEKPKPCYEFHMFAVWTPENGNQPTTWPNQTKVPDRRGDHAKAKEMAKRVDKATTGAPGPIVGKDDPENSHVAAQRIEPTRGSKRAQVLDHLRQRMGQWVDAPDLATEEVGGFGGTRRMRELRDMGWNIETRPKPGTTNTWQHRLVE